MRSFLVFLVVIAVIGLVWAVMPIAERHGRDQEQKLVASLNLVEEAIVGSSTDILRVDLFAPEIESLAGDGRWKLTGIVATQGRAGKAVHVRYVAAVAFSCTPYDKSGCGKIQTLTIEGQPLVVEGAIVAELQSVLDATVGTADEPLPGANDTATAAEPAALLAPQMGAAEPEAVPAIDVEANKAPTTEEPAEPTPPVATEPTPTVPAEPTPAVPAAPATTAASTVNDEPIQGDRQIFLIQKSLRGMGYDPGPVDGRVGPLTTSAIEAYQKRARLKVDGVPSAALLDHMIHATQ